MNFYPNWISGFPGMIWCIELSRSRMAVFNDWTHPLLGRDTARLIKDSQFRKQVVCREDLPLLAEYRDVMAGHQPAAVSFRLKNDPGAPLLLQGWPDPNDTDIYCGFLKYSCQTSTFISGSIFGSCQMALSRAGYPVLVVDVRTKTLLACNEAAKQRFSAVLAPDSLPLFSSIAPGEHGEHLIQAARKALEDDIWAGTLTLMDAGGHPVRARGRLSPCGSGNADAIVRIALLAQPEQKQHEEIVSLPDFADSSNSSDELLREGLKRLFAASPLPIDGLMFSDIQSLRGKVEVYGVGHCFERMTWGDPHAYEGTIAQDIERFGLTSLSVEDTLDSIKSIDWVMFIPHGVRSYFALPYTNANGLHAVLILASEQPGAFPADAESRFSSLSTAFEKLIALWRAKKNAA